jgi:hypothetical protein
MENRGQFEQISNKKHSSGTKVAYAQKINAFMNWIATEHPECIEQQDHSLILSEITEDIFSGFFEFIAKHKSGKKNDQFKSFSTQDGYRSALVNLFKENKYPVPQFFNGKLKDYFKGYRNQIADLKLNGELKAFEGKSVLSQTQYKTLCNLSFCCNSYMMHLFLVISWNLMTRSKSTTNIHFDHMKWYNDCIAFNIPKDKAHQSGDEGTQGIKHVYANPLDPVQCPILALGISLLCNTCMGTNRVLFNHKFMEENFNKWLQKQ